MALPLFGELYCSPMYPTLPRWVGGGRGLRTPVARRAMPMGAYAPGRVSHAGQVNGKRPDEQDHLSSRLKGLI